MNKTERHRQILKLVREHEIHTQEQLATLLRERGIDTTQVTLSRDIRELGLAKTQDGYAELVDKPAGPSFDVLVREFMTSAVAAQNLVIVRTSPGHAMSLAIALDTEQREDVLGTIAGDDTIFIALPDTPAAKALARELNNL
jgi:transcriptional regulator of arginine metabolism